MEYTEIKTERLILKPLGIEYLDTVNEYAMDRENTRYMLYLPNETAEETEKFLIKVDKEWQKDKPDYLTFAVIYNGVHIGAVDVDLYDGFGELGWIINKKYQKNGFACEAVRALIEYLKDHMNIRHFVAHCDSRNIPSYRLMEKIGMKKTAESYDRRNRNSAEIGTEYQYELFV